MSRSKTATIFNKSIPVYKQTPEKKDTQSNLPSGIGNNLNSTIVDSR